MRGSDKEKERLCQQDGGGSCALSSALSRIIVTYQPTNLPLIGIWAMTPTSSHMHCLSGNFPWSIFLNLETDDQVID